MMNHNPIETIFALYMLSLYPGLYWFLGRYTWRDLRGQKTRTHFGFRTGCIARLYGVFYLLVLLVITAPLPFWWQSLKDLSPAELAGSLTIQFPGSLGTGYLFLSLGLLFYLFVWGVFKLVQKRNPDWSKRIKKTLGSASIFGRFQVSWYCLECSSLWERQLPWRSDLF